jgi:adenine deaminase
MDDSLRKFIEGMPKIELHLHIEGSMEPETLMKLAARNGIELPYKDIDELKAAYKRGSAYKDLQEFLDLYYQGMNVLRTEEDFYDLTKAYLTKVASQNVTHTEIFFDPQGHTERGVAFDTAINGITRALDEAKTEGVDVEVAGRAEKRKVTSKLIMSFLRHMTEKEGFDTLEQARPHMDKIDGFGLDSSENGHPPTKFERLYDALRNEYPEKKLMAHAGEEGPAAYVWEAIDKLKIDRIDHGNHALDDAALVERLAQDGTGLTVCPLSNLKLSHTLDMDTKQKMVSLKEHRLKDMLAANLKATVNSDDPAYFDGYMTENFIAIAEALELTKEDIIKLSRNAIEVSFLSPEEKLQKNAELDAYIERDRLTSQYVNPDAGKQRQFG